MTSTENPTSTQEHTFTFDLDGILADNHEAIYWMAFYAYEDDFGVEPNITEFVITEHTDQSASIILTVKA